MEYFEAPAVKTSISAKPSIFLAGGITGCPDWQKQAVRTLRDLPVRIYNPRRSDFPEHLDNKQEAGVQIKWEFQALEACDIVLFWFPEESICPIALYELGRWIALAETTKKKAIVVGTHENYARREDIALQLELATGETELYNDLDLVLMHVKSLVYAILSPIESSSG